jgi:putative ABC transport system permease protein
VVRTSGDVNGFADQMRRTAQTIAPRAVIDNIQSAEALFTDRVLTPRRRMVLLTLLGALGLMLALVGVFGTTGYAVTRRTAEIGLRLAIGARPGQVVAHVARDSVWPIALGAMIGLGAAAMMTRAIASFLFETSPTDPLTLAIVATVLILTGSLAALLPAMRAAKVDPVATLRTE